MTTRIPMLPPCALLATLSLLPAMAAAQERPAAPQGGIVNEGDIIVTARRREETAQNTPVAITVLNDTLLDRYGVKGIATIAQLTPGLFTGEASGSVGGSISLRGIGSGDSQPFIDQAISLNVDGVPISSAQLLRAAQLDLKQIEVLRGPQALFFGKNSPGGIISLTSADPGRKLEILARAGYEFKAEEKYAEATLSAPITDTIGARIAARYSRMNGYINVISPATSEPGIINSTLRRFPDQEEIFLRGTLSFTPSDRYSLRLKATYTDTYINGGPSYYSDVTACPYGVPQGTVDVPSNCANDGTIVTAQLSPQFLALNPLMGSNPNGYRKNKQALLVAIADYDLTDTLKVTSVTGFYSIRERLASNGGYGLSSVNGFGVGFASNQFTQELRLASSFEFPVNFLVGGFYEQRNMWTVTFIGIPDVLRTTGDTAASQRALESTHQRQYSASLFGQLLWNPAEQVQVTAGGRYTEEIKRLRDYTVTPVGGTPVDVTRLAAYPGTRLRFTNFSPEVTLSYKPVQDVMLFASYKKGFKSGGFDAGYTAGAILANPRRSQTFNPEKVEGAEIGLKSTLLDRQLTFNLTGYYYDYNGLQVAVFDTTAQAFTTQNAAKARIKGVELETSFRPASIPGFNVHASAAFNDAKFREYLAACYNGQNVALGCNQVPNASGVFQAQDLAGRRLRKAPEFSATFGGYYEFPATDSLMVSLSADGSYSSGYDAGSSYQPLAYQKAFAKLDATLRLFTEDRKWEFALIGRNLTNKRNIIAGIDRTGTGSSATKGTTVPMCASVTDTGCNKLSDILGTPTQPISVSAQLTFRY
ncbi:MAG: TonB-dependent receptor [Sphingobium sp.]